MAFRRNLTQLGYEIVELKPYRQEYDFESVNTVAGGLLNIRAESENRISYPRNRNFILLTNNK